MAKKETLTSVYESRGKYTTTIPAAIVGALNIEKGDKLKWTIKDDKLVIEIRRQSNER